MIEPIRAAAQAKAELSQTDSAFQRLRDALIERIISSPTSQVEDRETCYRAIQTLDAVKTALHDVVDGGTIEEALQTIKPRAA